MTTSVRRPALITVLTVLIVIGGVFALVTGIIAFSASGGFALAGVLFVLLGIAYLAVARGLLHGNPTARIVVAVIAAVQLVLAVVGLLGDGTGAQRSSAIGSLVMPILILVVLFMPTSNTFFGARR